MLRTTIAGSTLDCCIYNASGPRTGSVDALSKIGESRSGAILSKSATLLSQEGNPMPRFINNIDMGKELCDGSMNSEGLPNYGIDYYISAENIKKLTSFNKPYIVSLSGLSLKDNLEMLSQAMITDYVTAVELNLACPNIPGKPTIAYDFEQMDDVLKQVTSHPLFSKKPLGIKLAPYFDMPFFERATTIISNYPIKFVVTCNTIGNALFIDTEHECTSIAAKGGLGGLGGGFIKPTALANVYQISQLLIKKGRSDIDVIGVGGIATGDDAFQMILCGAKAVQIGTCHWTEGPKCFNRIANELETIMKRKGYTSIEDFRGKLKPYEKHTNTHSKPNRNNSSSQNKDECQDQKPIQSKHVIYTPKKNLYHKDDSMNKLIAYFTEFVLPSVIVIFAYLYYDKHYPGLFSNTLQYLTPYYQAAADTIGPHLTWLQHPSMEYLGPIGGILVVVLLVYLILTDSIFSA
eukprot:gene11220-23450_t